MTGTGPATRRPAAVVLGLSATFVLLWNSGFIAAEFGLGSAPTLTFLLWRYAALAGLLLVVLLVRRRPLWPGAPAAAQEMVVGVLAHGVWLGCVMLSLDRGVPAGIVALIVALQPLLTGALSGPVVGEPTSRRQWIGLALGFCGVAVVVAARLQRPESAGLVGYLLPFFSVAGITAASLLQRRRSTAGHGLPLDLALFYQSAATAAAVVLPAVVLEGLSTDWNLPFVGSLAWLVVAVSFGAYAAMWRLLDHVEATRVASLFFLGPPVTMVMGWLAFGDRLHPSDLLGLGIVGAGVLLVQLRSGAPGRS